MYHVNGIRNNESRKLEFFFCSLKFVKSRQKSILRNSYAFPSVYLKTYLCSETPALYFERRSSRMIYYDILYYYDNIILSFIKQVIILHYEDTHQIY